MLASRLAVLVLPIALFAAWLLLGAALGRRRPSRFTVNAALSLLLVLYLAAVAGTGVFWVAIQELPVFDWHYLLGYLFFLLGITHLLLNRRALAAFLRRRAPAALKDPGGRGFRGSIRVLGAGLALTALAFAAFVAGGRFATRHAVILSREGAAPGPTAGPSLPRPLPPTMLRVGGEEITLARLYHRGSSYPARAPLAGVTWRSRPGVYKRYPGRPSVPLPPPRGAARAGVAVLEAARAWRAGARRLAASTIRLEDLALLLRQAQGITHRLPATPIDLRAAPSAGALYPVDLYVVATRVEGLEPGLYHLDVAGERLERLRSGPLFPGLEAAAARPWLYQAAPATVLVAVTFARSGFKYEERCYRYVCMDAGHVAFNLGLAAASLGLAAPPVARFGDAALAALLGIDGDAESPLLLMPIGRPLEGAAPPAPALAEPIFEKVPLAGEARGETPLSFLELIHGGTRLRRAPGWRPPASPAPAPWEASSPPPDVAGALPLPEPARGGGVLAAIRARRSVREHSREPIRAEELSALCLAAAGDGSGGGGGLGRFLARTAPLRLYVAVRDVEGIEAGVYLFDPRHRALLLLARGDVSGRCFEASDYQAFCATADALFLAAVRWRDLERPDGDRGYRYACMRAGMAGEGIYLQAASLGIGACSAGAFFDGQAGRIVGADPADEAVLYLVAAGR